MAVAVVEHLEVVDIDQQQRKRMPVTDSATPFKYQRFVEATAICGVGQGVRERHLFEAVTRLVQLALYADVPALQQGRAGRIDDDGSESSDRSRIEMLAHQRGAEREQGHRIEDRGDVLDEDRERLLVRRLPRSEERRVGK